jgi:transposase-like protein
MKVDIKKYVYFFDILKVRRYKMTRIRKEPNRYWSKEEKKKIIDEVLIEAFSSTTVAKKYDISQGMIINWIRKYEQGGIEGLENKKKPGNPLSKYSKKSNLSDIEKLQYENMKLRIENERLKKGYLIKGDGSIVVFKK